MYSLIQLLNLLFENKILKQYETLFKTIWNQNEYTGHVSKNLEHTLFLR